MITEYKTFLSLLDSSWALSICMTLKLCLRKFKGCLFEGCFLTIFSISLKSKNTLKGSMFYHFILVSKSKTLLYSEVLCRPAPGHKRYFYICGSNFFNCYLAAPWPILGHY